MKQLLFVALCALLCAPLGAQSDSLFLQKEGGTTYLYRQQLSVTKIALPDSLLLVNMIGEVEKQIDFLSAKRDTLQALLDSYSDVKGSSLERSAPAAPVKKKPNKKSPARKPKKPKPGN